jgi:ABC-2 type transport system permease protein
MKQALHAEWTKLRTQTGTVSLVIGAIVLTVAVSAAVAAVVKSAPLANQDLTKLSLSGIYLGQAVIAGLAVAAIGAEYNTGMIRVTLAAMPRRTAVLAAKACLVGGITLVAGTVAVLGSLLAGRLILRGSGIITSDAHPPPSLFDELTQRAAIGSVLYLVLIALLALGITTALRDSAAAIAVVFGLLYLFPTLVALVTNSSWRRHLQQIGPMTAGLAIQSTINLRNPPIGPWAGLAVLTAWASAALLIGGLLLRRRDA